MFDVATPRVLLGGKSGPMDISDFIDLVDRNKRVDGINWKRGKAGNALSHLCSIHVGAIEDGEARNVPTPVIPEFTDYINKDARIGIRARGWRMLLMLFIQDGWVYPSQEMRKWLGDPMWDAARMVAPCR